MKKQTIAFVKDDLSGLRMLDKDLVLSFLRDFGAGCKLKLTIEKYSPQRSLKQNKVLYWILDLLSEEASIEPERLKELLKYKFLKRPMLDKNGEAVIDESTGEVEWYVPSTTELSKIEFMDFIDKIYVWSSEFLGYELPIPDENYKINFQEEHKKKLINNSQ